MSTKMNRLQRVFALLISLVSLVGCGRSSSAPKILRVGFVPAEDAQRVIQNAQPIIDILQKKLGMEVQPFVATDYTGVIEALRANKLQIAFLTPASHARADSGINKLADLRGKTFAFGDPLSTSANVFPRKMFHEAGIDPARDFKQILYSGGHDATVLAVLNGKVDAGATYANSPDNNDTAWMRYLKSSEDVKKIHAIAFSEPIPADNLVINSHLEESLAQKVQTIFLDLSRDPKGKEMLRDLYQIDGFVAATDKDYESVRQAFAIAGI